jgi:hypothetical protein
MKDKLDHFTNEISSAIPFFNNIASRYKYSDSTDSKSSGSYQIRIQNTDKYVELLYFTLQRHCKENWKKYPPKGNCAASVPISTFLYLRTIYVFPRSVCLFGCSKIGGPILGIYINRAQMYEGVNSN